MYSIRIVFFAWLFVAPALVAGQDVLTIDQVLEEVSQNNPAIRALDSRIKSSEAKVEGAGAWMAPMVGAGTFMTPYPGAELMNDSEKGSWMFSAEQEIPNPSKIRAKKKYFASQSAISLAEQEMQVNQLKARARDLYYGIVVLHKKLGYQAENKMIMQNMKKLAEIRYPYNQGALGQVFKAEGRLYETENMLLMTEAEIQSNKIALNALMNRPPQTEFQIDTTLEIRFKPLANLDTAYLSGNRSDLKQMDRSILAMEYNIDQMRKEAKPDFRIRFEHMLPRSQMMPNQYSMMGMLSIPIAPWSSGMYKSEVKAMSFEQDAMKKERESMLTQMFGMTKGMENSLMNMERQLRNYKEKILPALRKNLQVSMLSYQENKGDLNTVIDGWEAINMAQMTYIEQMQLFYKMIVDYEKNIER